MDNKPYEKPFHWSYTQLFIVAIIILMIIVLVMWLQGPAPIGIQTNLIRNL